MTPEAFTKLGFAASDRPSPGFIKRFERKLGGLPNDMFGTSFIATFAGCVEGSVADCVASLQLVPRFAILSLGNTSGLIGASEALIDAVTERACGGDGSDEYAGGRGRTQLGHALAERMAAQLAGAIAPHLPSLVPGLSTTTEVPADFVRVDAAAIAPAFNVQVGDTVLGTIAFILPTCVLAQIESAQAMQNDPIWIGRLEHALAGVSVAVRAVLARPVLSAGEITRLAPGAVIPIPTMTDIALITGGYRVATGAADTFDGRAAIRIKRMELGL